MSQSQSGQKKYLTLYKDFPYLLSEQIIIFDAFTKNMSFKLKFDLRIFQS